MIGPLPPGLADAVAADPPRSPAQKIDELRALCEELRGLEADVAAATERLENLKSSRHQLRTVTVPDKMDQCGVAALELAARGNYPAVRVEVRPQVTANIAADWPDEKKRAAFDFLDANESGDLIKTTVELYFPREQRAAALALVEMLKRVRSRAPDAAMMEQFMVVARETPDFTIELSESVHTMTLGKWLRERIQAGLATPLDVIGGHAGRVATIKPVGGK